MKTKVHGILRILMSVLIAINIIELLTSIIFHITIENLAILGFDIFVCSILLFDFMRGMFSSPDRLVFLKQNWLQLLAAIPFDLFLAPVLGFNYLAIFKMIRVLLLLVAYFSIVGEFLKNTRLDEILGVLVFIIIGSTLGLYLVDPSMNNLFDNLWFVIVSITTVGYGDITPANTYGRVLSLALLVVGAFTFSAITGAMSSYFMDNVLQEGTYHIHDLKDKVEKSELELEKVNDQLKQSNEKIDDLKEEIRQLKESIEKRD